jgi:hypothetical protein
MSSIRPLGVTLAMVVVACAGQSRPPASAPQPGALPDCSTRTADQSVVHARYPRGQMEDWLKSDAVLRQRYGKSEVEDCADAERLAVLYWQREAERLENPLPQLPRLPDPIMEMWIDCSGVPGRPATFPAGEEERYYPLAMKDALGAIAPLRQRYGKSEVKDCTDARRFMALYQQEETRIFRDAGVLPPPPPSDERLLRCSSVPGGPPDRSPWEEEKYSAALLEAWLKADSVLRQSYGKSEVKDCADARRFMALYQQDEKRLLRANAAPDRQLDPPGYVREEQRILDCTDIPGDIQHPGAEYYILNVIANLLANDAELRQRYGKSEVRDCIDARRFVRIRREQELRMSEASPPFPLPPPSPPPAPPGAPPAPPGVPPAPPGAPPAPPGAPPAPPRYSRSCASPPIRCSTKSTSRPDKR